MDPLEFNILINPPFWTTNKRESPAFVISTGLSKPVAMTVKWWFVTVQKMTSLLN